MTRLAASLLDREGPGSSQKEPFCRYKPSDGLEPSAPLLAMWRVGVRIARTAAFGRILADALLLSPPGAELFDPRADELGGGTWLCEAIGPPGP